MDFSEVSKCSMGRAGFSPNGKHVAAANGYTLIVKDVESLETTNIFTCLDEINQISWSPDSKLIACAIHHRAVVEVFSLLDAKPLCTIEQGPAGVSNVIFAPDSQHLLVWADFQLRITIWAVFKKAAVAHIKFPKYSNRCFDFTPTSKRLISPSQKSQEKEENEEENEEKATTKYGIDRKTYFAYGERKDCKDFVSIVHCETWELIKTFPVKTKHLHDIKWSPGNGRFLCVWDSILDYQIFIYSPTGQCIHSYSAYENALGIRTVRWSPTAQLLAIGSFDMKIRLLNNMTWNVLSEYEHKPAISSPEVLIFKEVEILPSSNASPNSNDLMTTKTRYIVEDSPITLTITNNPSQQSKKTAADPTQKPKNGVALMEWSHDCKYICSKVEEFPNVLWIWDTAKLALCSVLVQMYPIKDVKWDPSSKNRLALCTSNSRVYFWSEEGTSCVDIPSHGFVVTSIDWDKNGKTLLLKGKNAFCLAYPGV